MDQGDGLPGVAEPFQSIGQLGRLDDRGQQVTLSRVELSGECFDIVERIEQPGARSGESGAIVGPSGEHRFEPVESPQALPQSRRQRFGDRPEPILSFAEILAGVEQFDRQDSTIGVMVAEPRHQAKQSGIIPGEIGPADGKPARETDHRRATRPVRATV